MTDRHAAYIVVLEDDIRDDDAGESVLIALRMIKGVASVEPVIADYPFAVARTRRDSAWRDALYELARQGPSGTGDSS